MLFLRTLIIFAILCEEGKYEENQAILRSKYLKKYWSDFFQFWYVK